ncbi:hypothetical protein ACHOLT_17565 [Desulfitobacterium sp. Sab5]|uniref:hypothetical protein n=1 Tax=Desulfitobacterium nosdiversum TaxID=3375356 RepID=UPI003CED0E66
MLITRNYAQPTLYPRTITKSEQKQKPEYVSGAEEKPEAEDKLNESADIWKELSGRYDIQNASFSELCDISKKLYAAGQISFLDYGMIIFDPSQSSQPLHFDINVTSANRDGRRDWIAEFEARASAALKFGNTGGYTENRKIAEILSRLV